MMQNVLKQLHELHREIEQLPSEHRGTLIDKIEQLSSSVQQVAVEFESFLFPNTALKIAETITVNLQQKSARQGSIIRQLENQLEQQQRQYKKATQALVKSQAKHQTILRNASDLITIVDDLGRIREQSSAAVERVLGYKPEQRIGELCTDLLHPDDVPIWQAYFAKLLQHPGIAGAIQYRKLHASGYWVYLEAVASNLLHDSSINGIVINSREITQRKIAEKALQKFHSQLEKQTHLLDTVLSTTPDKLFMFDISQRLTYINRAGLELARMSEACIFGKTLAEIGFPPELIEVHGNCWEKILATKQSFTAETDFIHPRTGRQNYCSFTFSPILSAKGSIEAILVTNRDITELKTAEAALRESEARYRTISQITSDFAYSFNTLPDRTWGCEWMTEAFTRITGYTPEEIETEGWLQCDCIHPDDRKMLLEQMQDRSANCQEVSEYRIVTKTGEIRWLWDCRQVVWDEIEGRTLRIYGACQDITEHKLAEAKLCQTNQFLQELIAALPIAVFGIDANALVTLWNPGAERIFGWKESEVLGEVLPIVPSDENTDFYAMFQAELAGESQVGKKCLRRRKDGSLIEVCIWSTPLRDTDGSIAGTMRIVSEILAAKETQQYIGKLQSSREISEPFWARYVRLPNIIKQLTVDS